MRKLVSVAAVFGLVIAAFATGAEERPQVYFAGFSFGGLAAERQNMYPHASLIVEREPDSRNLRPVDATLLQRAEQLRPISFELLIPGNDTLDLASLEGANSKVLTVVLDGEFVSIDRMSDHFQVTIWLSGQIIIFSFDERKIITSHPFGVRRKTVFDEKPSNEAIRNIVSEMLLQPTTQYNPNFFDAFTKRAKDLVVQPSTRGRIQVGEVSIDPRSHRNLPETYLQTPQSLDRFRSFVATTFTKSFSEHTGRPVLPYLLLPEEVSARRIALNAGAYMTKLMSQVADARVYNLEVPEPDFVFNIKILGFRKALLEENPGSERWVFGSFVDISLYEPFRGRELAESRVRFPEVADLPTGSGQTIDDWGEYRESLFKLLNGYCQGLSTQKPSYWLEAQENPNQTRVILSRIQQFIN